jgi:hypothetical protein
MAIGASLRRMLPLDVQVALRDAEKDLSSWRTHLHPHVQRLVYCYFLGSVDDGEEVTSPLTTILTKYSPHIGSVTPIRSIVLLRYDAEQLGAKTCRFVTSQAG